MSVAVEAEQAAHSLQCMEIWGGNRAIESAISVPGIDAWVYNQPYAQQSAGGDIYYVSSCGRGKISRFVVADVAGHGKAVDHLATSLRALMRRYINTLDQTRFVRTLNEEFSAFATDGDFATALLTTYFAPNDHLVICNAGHPPPLWYRASERSWQPLRHDGPGSVDSVENLPIGVVAPTNYYQFAVPLEKGDLVLVYTDSLIEGGGETDEPLGAEGLLELVRQIDLQDPAQFFRKLLTAVAERQNHQPPNDDMTVLLLHHNAASPPPQSMGEMVKVIGKMLHLIKV